MKIKLHLLSFLLLLTVATNYAQGIAVQGIARDENNTAKGLATLNFKFSIYYTKGGTVYTPVTKTEALTTDAFGVFSYVIPAEAIDNTTIFENELYLKIEQLTAPAATISDEKLNYVPYAMNASNGVPTGSIMPYIGETAPRGWVLCDGSALPATATALKSMIGNNTPNLKGMFIRGTGTSPVNNQAGPALKATQGESFKDHTHSAVHDHTQEAHSHNVSILNNVGTDTYNTLDNDAAGSTYVTYTTDAKTPVIKNYTGDTQGSDTGGKETRPVNYGVNYIIKL